MGNKEQSYAAGRLYYAFYAWRKTKGYARIGKTTRLAGGCLLCCFCFFKLPFKERKYPRCNAGSHAKLFSAICKMLWGRCDPYNLRGALVFLIHHSESRVPQVSHLMYFPFISFFRVPIGLFRGEVDSLEEMVCGSTFTSPIRDDSNIFIKIEQYIGLIL